MAGGGIAVAGRYHRGDALRRLLSHERRVSIRDRTGTSRRAGVDNGPLHAPRDGTEGGRMASTDTARARFPNQTYNSENYWVDVVFVTSIGPDTTPPTVASVSPGSGSSGVAVNSAISATFNENVANVTTTTFELRDGANALVPAAVSYVAATRTATLTPNAALAYSTPYTATAQGRRQRHRRHGGQHARDGLHLDVHDGRAATSSARSMVRAGRSWSLDRPPIHSAAITPRSCVPKVSMRSRPRTSPRSTPRH